MVPARTEGIESSERAADVRSVRLGRQSRWFQIVWDGSSACCLLTTTSKGIADNTPAREVSQLAAFAMFYPSH
ncbi:hypothetical protein KGM_211957 [Danaus plexippus plexippus]|uniref:Uncharacterized protein n=1 Tax=Danaus plexippus plexippus TaxID=278856 RepID=A0A212FI11_DANPL|nr:hypothetical protein KGM_211957 [Danaus plexippus plexippus]